MGLGIIIFIFLCKVVILSFLRAETHFSPCLSTFPGCPVIYCFWMNAEWIGCLRFIVPLRFEQFPLLDWHDLVPCFPGFPELASFYILTGFLHPSSPTACLVCSLLPFPPPLPHQSSACHQQMSNSYFQSWWLTCPSVLCLQGILMILWIPWSRYLSRRPLVVAPFTC